MSKIRHATEQFVKEILPCYSEKELIFNKTLSDMTYDENSGLLFADEPNMLNTQVGDKIIIELHVNDIVYRQDTEIIIEHDLGYKCFNCCK